MPYKNNIKTNRKRLQNYLCVTRRLSTRFLLVLTFCEQLLTFFQEESQAIRDERKDHGALDESSSEQQVRELADYTLIVRKNWAYPPSVSRSYRKEGVR